MSCICSRNFYNKKEGGRDDAITDRWGWFPSKNEVIELGAQFALPVVIVTSVDHYTAKEYPDFVHFVYVDKGADRADYEIVKEKFNRAIF